MIIKKGMLWVGLEWEEAIKKHLETSDCYILEVYKDTSSSLLKSNWVFDCFKLMAYGNRFKEYKTLIPKKYLIQVVNSKKDYPNKFKMVDKWGSKVLT